MNAPILYRKRLIPSETLLLKDDIMLYRDERRIITRWNTIRPKKSLHHGFSCYLLDKGVKVNKFYDHSDNLICWYCDIISHSYDPSSDTYIFTDLLADVLLYPDGRLKVVDLDEMADAVEQGLLSEEMLLKGLRRTNWLLTKIYDGSFAEIQEFINQFDAPDSGR